MTTTHTGFTKSIQTAIHDAIQARRDEYTTLLQDWVRDVTLSGQEAGHQSKIYDLYLALGLDTDKWEVDIEELRENPLFHSPRDSFTGSPNVVGTWKGTGDGRSLIMNGHVDVVPEGDHNQWQQHPYSGEIIDGHLYGRGVTDMKGGNMSSYNRCGNA